MSRCSWDRGSPVIRQLVVYREHVPGFANAYLLLSAPQLGVRHGGALSASAGSRARTATPRPDEIGMHSGLDQALTGRLRISQTSGSATATVRARCSQFAWASGRALLNRF